MIMTAAALKKEVFETNENFAALFEASLQEEKAEGSVVIGTVIGIEKDMVIIDVGLKSEGRIPMREFTHGRDDVEVNEGDEVEIFLEKYENRYGEVVLSREKALREQAWVDLEKASEEGERVMGVIFGRVKGGFTVDIKGAVAFLPGSQVDVRPIKDISPLMNIEQPFQILKMDRKRGNIVVSRRAVLEESRTEARNELLDAIHEGQVLDGIVKNITDYGAFIDMGGVDGLLHVTDISWKRINHPSEVFSIGDTIKVMVTKYDKKTKRVSLGMKQLEDNPWKDLGDRFKVGNTFEGHITNITDYGAFVELDEGIEGLVHVSEMSWTKKNTHPNRIVTAGEKVKVMIIDVETDKHRISLGMKQCEANPWAAFAEQHKESDIIEGEVRNITEFGLFIGLEGDIDGLVHHSDISWTEASEEAIKSYNKGDTVKAKILTMDVEKERISLGVKQLDSNPVDKAFEGVSKGTVVTCEVTEVDNNGIHVKFNDNLTAYIKKADLSKDKQDQRPERFAVGDRVDAKITSVTKSTQKVNLSIKALEIEEQKKAIEEFGSADSGATLGDILGAALDEAKEDTKESKSKATKKKDE